MALSELGGPARHQDLAGLDGDSHKQYALAVQNTLANRPASSRAGRLFYATDESRTYYDTGTAWEEILTGTVSSAAFIAKALIDAKGDLLVGSAADTVVRLAPGTDGQVLTADSATAAGVKWATAAAGGAASGVRLSRGAGLLTANATATDVVWDSEHFDTDGYWTSGAGVTIPAGLGGKFLITGRIWWDLNATGHRRAEVFVGTTVLDAGKVMAVSAEAQATVPFSTTAQLAAGDVIKVVAYQNSGGDLTVLQYNLSQLSVIRIGA